jgi:hypothetical protein
MIVFLARASLAVLLVTYFATVGGAQEFAATQSDALFVKVSQDREITGMPVDLTEIKVITSFGEVTIPLAKIDGIKLHADKNDSAVIAFKNGDLVTGMLSLEVINVKTEWGTAHVNTAQIDTLGMDPNARFYTDSNGGAWRFSKIAPSTLPAQPVKATTLSPARRK